MPSPEFEQRGSAVRAEIADRSGEHLAACDRMWAFGVDVFESWPEKGRRVERQADGILVAIFVRSINTFACATRLVRDGYATQAAMLDRSLFEDMVDAHWIHRDPDLAEKRLEQHRRHSRMITSDLAKKHPQLAAVPGINETFTEEERKTLDGLYTKHGTKPWSAIILHERLKLIEDQWADYGGASVLWFMHDIAHRANNNSLHVSSASIAAVIGTPVGDEGQTFNLGPSGEMVDPTLWCAAWCFSQTVGLVLNHFQFDIDVDERARALSLGAFIRLSAEDVKGVGRNVPCPCGSGLKFKRCHEGKTLRP